MHQALAWLQSGIAAAARARHKKKGQLRPASWRLLPRSEHLPLQCGRARRSPAWKRPGGSSRSSRKWQTANDHQPSMSVREKFQHHAPQFSGCMKQQRSLTEQSPRRLRTVHDVGAARLSAVNYDTPNHIAAKKRARKTPTAPTLIWSASRKHHNKLMHALNGNTSAASATQATSSAFHAGTARYSPRGLSSAPHCVCSSGCADVCTASADCVATTSLRASALWAHSRKQWNKLMHVMNGNSAASPCPTETLLALPYNNVGNSCFINASLSALAAVRCLQKRALQPDALGRVCLQLRRALQPASHSVSIHINSQAICVSSEASKKMRTSS